MEEVQAPPKVSVLIVSWNSAAPLRRCLESLERSTDRETMEIVVVDNGSQDESPRLDAEYPKVNLLRLPRNFGLIKALNIGMRTAVGEFFFFLRPEMEVFPETVCGLASRLDAASDAVAVCPLLVSPEGQSVSLVRGLPSPREVYRAWCDGDFPDWRTPEMATDSTAVQYPKGAALMARSNFLRGMRYIDERYGNRWWDLELCCQIRRVSKKVLLLPNVRTIAHSGPSFVESLDTGAQALLSADYALGAAAFAGKHYGWLAGLKLRITATLHAFGAALVALARLGEVHYHFSRFSHLVNGQKIDGSQRDL
jgi:GT2 family glycosyltransferase